MPRSATTGLQTRVDNSFSNPVVGTEIDPDDADTFFDDVDNALNAFQGTSTTSLTIGTGAKTFTMAASISTKAFIAGMSLHIFSLANPSTNYMDGTVTSYDSVTGALVTNILAIGGAGTLTDWVILSAGARGAVGATGSTGATSGIKQAYSSTTADADPGAGVFRLNNATPASATAAYLDNLDSGGATVSGVWDLFDDSTNTVRGNITFEKSTDPTVWARFQITGSVVDGTGYRKLTLANGQGSGAFTNGDTFAITFARAGNVGSGDLISTNNLSDVTNKQTSRDNLSLHGADIASAGTINLDTATGYVVDVTGTTGITAVTLADGKNRIVRFTGALTLTNGASLVLPGAANITTVAGDYAIFVGYAAGVVRCMYFPSTTAGMRSLAAAAGSATTVSAGGLATGGGDLSANRTITVTAAVQADLEAATSTTTAVTPAVVKNHPGVAKAWVTYTEITTTTNNASHNVSSLTDNGAGDTTINFTTAFSSANYGISAFAGNPSTAAAFMIPISAGKVAGSLRIGSYSTGVALTDFPENNVVVFGDQ